MNDSLFARLNSFHERNSRWLPAAFFVGGFVFDAVMFGRIDEPMVIVQQLVYLTILSGYVFLEFRHGQKPLEVPRRLQKLWSFHHEVAHFMFGTLLNLYTLLYFKSASLISAAVFLTSIVIVLFASEFKAVKKLGTPLHVGLLSFCLTSFFAALLPMAFGFIGLLPFLTAIAVTLVWLWILRSLVHKISGAPLMSRAWKVGAGVQAVLLVLYVLRAIPPVPLSANFLGIYHEVRQENGKYQLLYDRPWWKIWQRGDQSFRARPGDKIYAFASVFSPTGVKDQIRVRWSYYDPRAQAWQKADSIPILIKGGREEGFRGFAYKQNYQNGDWRVSLETSDGREFARLGFSVSSDTASERRTYYVDER